jgi:hypothetical protein
MTAAASPKAIARTGTRNRMRPPTHAHRHKQQLRCNISSSSSSKTTPRARATHLQPSSVKRFEFDAGGPQGVWVHVGVLHLAPAPQRVGRAGSEAGHGHLSATLHKAGGDQGGRYHSPVALHDNRLRSGTAREI